MDEEQNMNGYRKAEGALMRSRLIVLDGPRCSGKSSLGKGLEQSFLELGWSAAYFKKTKIDPVDEGKNMHDHLDWFKERLENGMDVIICDRLVASEFVFATVTQRTPLEQYFQYCAEVAWRAEKEFNALQNILLPPLEILEDRMLARDAEGQGPERLWDMPKERIHPLWRLTARALPGQTIQQTVMDLPDMVDAYTRFLIQPYKTLRPGRGMVRPEPISFEAWVERNAPTLNP